jgi:hypothetical protein
LRWVTFPRGQKARREGVVQKSGKFRRRSGRARQGATEHAREEDVHGIRIADEREEEVLWTWVEWEKGGGRVEVDGEACWGVERKSAECEGE